tara:strand:+ start:1767 stop:2849 length:1083 start_codon:yes stop_codon:yes gene_type:complete
MTNKRKVLLNPGPVTLTNRVRNSLLNEDLCHREDKFSELLLGVKKKLLEVYKLDNNFDAVILAGSGTSAVEAMLKSLISKEDKVLVLSNGVYGERMASMLELDHREIKHIKNDWLLDVDFKALEIELNKKEYSKVVSVHNETTTGRLNNIDRVIDLCEKYSTPLLLDAVSSFGGENINFDSPALLAVAATANKCLHGITGASFVISKHIEFKKSEGNSSSLYLDLNQYWRNQLDGWCPFTPSIHSIYALDEALNELLETGGFKSRNIRYKELSNQIRNKFKEKKIPLLIDEEHYSSMISSFYLPEERTYQEIYQNFMDSNFVIYSGQGDLANKIFRICNMGDITNLDLENLFKEIEETFS